VRVGDCRTGTVGDIRGIRTRGPNAEINYPWCIMGDTRGRNRGFGGQCIENALLQTGRTDRFR
jgi:hypothetical protein